MNKTYSELITLPTFEERFNYLKIPGVVGRETFGYDRWLNQKFYSSAEWKRLRNFIISRDYGRDLGVEGFELRGQILIHHINPLSKDDIANHSSLVIDPENLITTCPKTHNAIHYGDMSQVDNTIVTRKPFDTCPWR
jgi:hypothetical protein